MPAKKNESVEEIYQIKVTLLRTKPPIWRRLLVPGEFTLAQLHNLLQVAMGWEDYHLHEFLVGRERFGVPDPDDKLMGVPACIHERKVRISDVFLKPGSRAEYTYDFGDGWAHDLSVEKILLPEPGLSYPLCTDGKLHGPPEDCGGIGGFYNFLEAIQDPRHSEHADLLAWIGGSFDPESFSPAAVNHRLHDMFLRARRTPRKRVAPKAKRATTD
jgi:hypothetical protein